MKEIKFRIWNKLNNKMMDHNDLNVLLKEITKLQFVTGILVPQNNDCQVMQYTGLRDKNGVEIYEGDIVKHISKINDIIIGPVIFRDGCFAIKTKFGDKYLYTGTNKVIGNIYENPEL